MSLSILSYGKKVLVAGVLMLSFSTSSLAADYDIDIKGMHAFVQFRIAHLGYSVMVGRFNDFDGSFSWDEKNPGDASINVTIDTASVDTNHAERDKHLRGSKFLDVEKYPEATFKSTKYHGDIKGGKLDGILTLHGVSKPITLDAEVIGQGKDPWGGYRAGFSATTTIKRSDFDVGYNLGPASETMEFELHIEGIRK